MVDAVRRRKARRGLSLLEVIVAIAILGGAMAVIANLVFIGSKAAADIRWTSDAQILCDTKMAELSAGVMPLQSIGFTTVVENPVWVYSVDIGSTTVNGLLSATVTVQEAQSATSNPKQFTLMRWLPDPDYEPEQAVLQ
jgi:prepilin-type N-terminal cleavage/methylation domain-containing protein